ncbi:MAG: HisA/HisF-related TIM barrel protein [Microthrixaceae bacterium]
MDFYPAIDLLGGQCVRLYQGDYERETVYGDDPVSQARSFEAAGAQWIHVVDLDAARSGEPVNRPIIAQIAQAVNIPVQTGGGVRDEAAAKAHIDAGVAGGPGYCGDGGSRPCRPPRRSSPWQWVSTYEMDMCRYEAGVSPRALNCSTPSPVSNTSVSLLSS